MPMSALPLTSPTGSPKSSGASEPASSPPFPFFFFGIAGRQAGALLCCVAQRSRAGRASRRFRKLAGVPCVHCFESTGHAATS